VAHVGRVPLPDQQVVRGDESRDRQREVDQHLDEPAAVHDQRLHERRPRDLRAVTVDLREKTPELHEQCERHERPDQSEPPVAEHSVPQARRGERGGRKREEHHRALLGHSPPDEPV